MFAVWTMTATCHDDFAKFEQNGFYKFAEELTFQIRLSCSSHLPQVFPAMMCIWSDGHSPFHVMTCFRRDTRPVESFELFFAGGPSLSATVKTRKGTIRYIVQWLYHSLHHTIQGHRYIFRGQLHLSIQDLYTGIVSMQYAHTNMFHRN